MHFVYYLLFMNETSRSEKDPIEKIHPFYREKSATNFTQSVPPFFFDFTQSIILVNLIEK